MTTKTTTTTTTHTPGPWTIHRGYASTNATPVRGTDGNNIAWVCGTDADMLRTKETTQANARLISAAPDLLAALESCLDSMERNGPPPIQQGTHCEEQDWTTAIRQARAAIAKATGGAA